MLFFCLTTYSGSNWRCPLRTASVSDRPSSSRWDSKLGRSLTLAVRNRCGETLVLATAINILPGPQRCLFGKDSAELNPNAPNLLRPMIASLPAFLAHARQQLRNWASPLANPFLAQSRRVDARGARWVFALVFIAILWLFAMGAALALARETNRQPDWANTGALVWIGIVWVIAWGLERVRDSELLRQEIIKGRFEPLQLLPISSTQRAWLWSAPNSLWGLTLCAAMLPAIAWGLGGGLFEWREAALLIFIVTLSLWSAPSWAPTAWRVAGAKPAPTGKDALKMVGNNMANSGNAKNRIGDGFVLPPDLAVNARGWGGGLSLTAPVWFMAQFGMAGMALGVARAYWAGLPPHVRAASDEIWFNWPLFLVRWLGEAQPFFGFALAPITLILPIWLASATNRVLRLAAVTGREQFWTPKRFTLWKRAQTVQSALGFTFLLGLLWPGAIANEAWLSNWFGKLAGTPVQALAAWWIVAVAAGALSATAMWRASLELPVGALSLRAQGPRATRLAARGLGVALGFWALGCLLGARWPLNALWLQVVPATLTVAAVWIAAQCASHAAQRAPRAGNAFAAWHFVWFYGGPLGGAALLVLAQFPVKLLTVFYPLSPWTLWLMLRDPNVGANSIFWIACSAHAVLALITGALAWRLGRDRITATATAKATANAPDNEERLDELAPNAPPANAPALPATAQTVSLTRRPLPAPDAWTARLLEWLVRFDNPILTLEMRRAITGNPREIAKGLLILQALVASVPLAILPVLNIVTGYWDSHIFAVFVGIMLSIPCAAILTGTSGASLCYDRDRMDGTLELLFLTPRTSDEIARGKVAPFIVRAALLGAAFLPMFLVGALLLPTASQSLLSAAYFAAPLWICALALRGVVGSHWMALKKRKVGPSNVSFGISLVVALGLIIEFGAMIGAFFLGAPFAIAAAILLSAIYILESLWLWKRGVAALERWRLQGAPGAK